MRDCMLKSWLNELATKTEDGELLCWLRESPFRDWLEENGRVDIVGQFIIRLAITDQYEPSPYISTGLEKCRSVLESKTVMVGAKRVHMWQPYTSIWFTRGGLEPAATTCSDWIFNFLANLLTSKCRECDGGMQDLDKCPHCLGDGLVPDITKPYVGPKSIEERLADAAKVIKRSPLEPELTGRVESSSFTDYVRGAIDRHILTGASIGYRPIAESRTTNQTPQTLYGLPVHFVEELPRR